MGLQLQTSFDTPQGFSVTSVYCRIARVLFDAIGSGEYTITLSPETYLSREHRLNGKFPLGTPGVPTVISVRGVLGDMTYLYGLLKSSLESRGLVVEDVLEPTPEVSQQSSESTQTTLPTPPQPEAPQES